MEIIFTPKNKNTLSALFILLGVSLVVASGFLLAFLWSTRSGQYDDDYTPSVRILFEDKPKHSKTIEKQSQIKSEKTINSKRNQK